MRRPCPSRMPSADTSPFRPLRASTERATRSLTVAFPRRHLAGQPARRSVGVVLFLPDRQPQLDLLDHLAAGREGLGAVRARSGDGHTDVTDAQLANAVH